MADSETLFGSCAEVLSLCQGMKGDLAAILDPETGFAPRLRGICNTRLQTLEESGDENDKADMEVLRLEQNTWGLLQAIMPARKTEAPPSSSPSELLAENPYTPTSTLAQSILNASPLLMELIVVREWLHETAPEPTLMEPVTGYWKFTKHQIMHALRSGRRRDGLVEEMDPDCAGREDGRGIAADDTNFEKNLAQALYAYVRAGRLDDAIELCRESHQPWRAASIRGLLLFQWKAISNENTQEEDAMDDDNDEPAWHGNRHRKLWKATCIRAALNSRLTASDRVLYASLAPTPQTSLVLKSACRTWEDHLWAQLSIMCEEKQSSEMIRLGGSFWDSTGNPETKTERVDEDIDEEREWEEEVKGTLEGLKDVHVLDGPPADNAFHFSQLYIILNRTDELLDVFAEGLRDGSHAGSGEYATMCRFFAHLCLFLQMIDIPVPPMSTQIILEAYLGVLETQGQRDLIALYATSLGENAVSRYALFLTSLALSADLAERRLALTRAREHGLDVARVAVESAERTIEKAFQLLPPLKGPLPSLIKVQEPPTEPELLLLRSIEWTTFSEETYEVALEQACVILRYFLACGRVQLAYALLNVLPPELATISSDSEDDERATEYLHYRQFFIVWGTLERVVECQALEVRMMGPGASASVAKETREAWVKDYVALIEQAREQISKLLTSEWLVSDVENVGGNRRRRELIRIRQIYIPELIIRLHHLLVSSRSHVPRNLHHALALANTVADSRYKLYEDFVNEEGRRLGDYLSAVRAAVVAGLDAGGVVGDVFRGLSAI